VVNVLGMYASDSVDLASGVTIMLTGTAIFLIAWLMSAGPQDA
jgi:ABC-type Mn2+/Zn2+ transport system permease subunit